MPSTVIGIVREMIYFWELFNLLFQPRCTNPKCGSYDLEATGEIIRFPFSEYSYANPEPTLSGVSMPSVLLGYKCNKCQDVSFQ